MRSRCPGWRRLRVPGNKRSAWTSYIRICTLPWPMHRPPPPLNDESLRELIPRLRRFARSLTQDQAAADDLVQATLERALTHGAERRTEGALQPWLFSVLYRKFIDEQRRARRWKRIACVFSVEDDVRPATPDQVLAARTALADFSRLTDEQRALLILVSVEDFGYREAANVLGIPIGTVMSRLSRARQALRAMQEDAPPVPSLRSLK